MATFLRDEILEWFLVAMPSRHIMGLSDTVRSLFLGLMQPIAVFVTEASMSIRSAV